MMQSSLLRSRRLLLSAQKRLSASTSSDVAATVQPPPSIVQMAWDSYSRRLYESPLLTKATMAAIIFFTSDSATQYLTRKEGEPWQASRALSGASFGIVATTWLHYWWGFLETAVGRRVPAQSHRLANTLIKVVVDQAIGAPLYIYTYYILTNFLSQLAVAESSDDLVASLETTMEKASSMLWPTMLRHWTVWPAVHSLNFYFMPLHHRVLVQNTVLVGWSGYLSHLNNTSSLMTPDEEVKSAIVRRETELRLQAKTA